MSQPKRILMTGGRGRLASLIADHFRAPVYAIAPFSRDSGEGFGDLASLESSEAFEQADTFLHLAWSSLPATSEKNPHQEWQNDLPRLEKMLAAMSASNSANRIHFVFFSSGGTVYGNANGHPSNESDQCKPIGWYGRAKRAAEEIIEAHAARHGLACTILRISNPYGYPVPQSRAQGIIPHALRCAVSGQPLTLWGDGHAKKDFLYYTDFLSALDQVIALRLTGTFNLSAGESHSVREVIALVEKHTGRKVELQCQPGPTWDVQDSRLDNKRIVSAANWKPQVSISEGIRRAAAGYTIH
ncbi:MAG TPA: NAD-dependent epimerase/dehydratase family protein [Lacunisphaera sp.]|jgi:UDP-glucose 4-epimerase